MSILSTEICAFRRPTHCIIVHIVYMYNAPVTYSNKTLLPKAMNVIVWKCFMKVIFCSNAIQRLMLHIIFPALSLYIGWIDVW